MKGRVTLTKSQEQIWMGQQMNPDVPLYNMAFAFHVYSEIDVATFKLAFHQLVLTTDAMRMIFPTKELPPLGRILPDMQFDLAYSDLSDLADPESHLDAILGQKCKELCDIEVCSFDSAIFKINEKHFVWYLNQHHLITDGWSKALIFKKMSALYENRIADKPIVNTYSDYTEFINFELEKRNSPSNKKTETYWVEKYGNVQPVHFVGKQNMTLNTESKRINFNLDKERLEALQKRALEPEMRGWTLDHTMFNIFVSLFSVLLYRLSGESEIVIGSPVHNRSQSRFKENIGLLIEVFPIGVVLDKEDTFFSVFQKTQSSTLDFLKNAHTGCSSTQVNKGFSAFLNYSSVTFGDFAGAATTSFWLHSGHNDPRHGIKLEIHNFNDSEGLELFFDFNTKVFTDNFDATAVDQFVGLIDQFLEDSTRSINTLSAKELSLLDRFNDTDKKYPGPYTVIDLIDQQVAHRADNPAIVFGERTLTFKQLDHKANQLGHLLQSHNIGKGDLVGVCMDRSLEMIVSLLGIIKAGAAYVPIDPNYPEDRIQFMLEDIAAKVILTNNGHSDSIKNLSVAVILEFETGNQLIEGLEYTDPIRDTQPEDLIYTIYTSGTSGRPKGVMNQHDAVVNLIKSLDDIFHLSPEKDVLLLKTTFCFDVSVMEIFYPLAYGIKVIIAEPDGHMDPRYLERIVDQHKVTTIHFVPSMCDAFLAAIRPGSCLSLDHVICAGEALKQNTAALHYRNLPNAVLHNLYGPTETAVDITHKAVAGDTTPADRITIGGPWTNVKIHVLNHDMEPCAIGSIGELCIEGIQVARGYHNRNSLNKQYFVNKGEKRLYKSGDLGRWLPNGELECLGRIDEQIKIRGFRVELQEIESTALQYEGIELCAVRALPDYMNSSKLVLYFTANSPLNIALLQSYLKTKLPDYMIPAVYLEVEAMPLSTNGKLDKSLLPIPDYNEVTSTLNIVEPYNEFETIICDVWKDILDVSQISTQSNFFNIGGDSLLGIRVIGKLNKIFEIDMPVVAIFKDKSIAQLAIRVEGIIKELLLTMEN